MIVDARTLPDGSRLEADVAVVGAGPAGITVALELAGRGRKVVLLESGGLETDEATRSLSRGTIAGRPYFPLESARSRVLGGTTDQWAGECRPLDAADFEAWDGRPGSGWPFGREELDPWYDRARPWFELGSAPFASDDWTWHGVEPLALDCDGPVRTSALHYSPIHFGVAHRDALKASDSIDVLLHATVVEIETPDPPGRVACLRAATLAGTEIRVSAGAYVLAGGGIENPRLLLASNRASPAGLGNAHDLVGRYFMEHLFVDEAAVVRSPAGTVSDFYEPGAEVSGGVVRGLLELDPDLRRREGLPNVGAVFRYPEPGEAARTARYVIFETLKGRPPVAASARLRWALRERVTGRASTGSAQTTGGASTETHLLKLVMEQAPNPESRIVLSEERGALGMPRVELRWRLSDVDRQAALTWHEILDEVLGDAGLRFMNLLGRKRDAWPRRLRGGRHHMGTTRMHVDPRYGVVDPDGRVHGTENLWIAGSSVFPTGGAANPTFTIVALALRLAEQLG